MKKLLFSLLALFLCAASGFTQSTSGYNNGHEYVDLGLPSGLLWATMNVGASKPEEYGSYFAWGETTPKSSYNSATYKWYKWEKSKLDKYCTSSVVGTVDNKTTLDLSDDAAHANWGGTWRMPTITEQNELRTKCKWTWGSLHGIKGYKVTGPNGNSIFLPAAGYRHDGNINIENIGWYWSSSLDDEMPLQACFLAFFSNQVAWGSDSRRAGQSVRAVCLGFSQQPMNSSSSSTSGNNNGHRYVDLGLSVKWATMNIGATAPEGYGSYFAWGETTPKSTYFWDSYKWCRGYKDTMTKYCTSSKYGSFDNQTTLALSDDAARANWGGTWRMPTIAEQNELRDKCTWTWTTLNDVRGCKVTGPNGNSIFLPAAGHRDGSSLYYAGTGYYWSSSLHTNDSNYVFYLEFHSDRVIWFISLRKNGFPVRAVCP